MKPRSKKPGNIYIVLALSLGLLLSLQTVQSLGVTRPVPYDVQLMKGEEAGFYFEIQAVTSTEKQLCTYGISGLEPLQVTFEKNEAVIEAGSIENVYGKVKVPDDAQIKTYSGSLSVSCGAYTEGQVSGSVVKTTVGGSPFNVRVVELRTREIRDIGPSKEAGFDYTTIIILLAIIIIIVVTGVYYKLAYKKKK
ncbi:MAG: hypothetical protein NTY20_04135 [Candidatus Aenigmarchaeota archaeon]|nr:hypothetical protein [Candidatus Aenigmarchaeota archaeon]